MDQEALERALRALEAQHDALRLRYDEREGRWRKRLAAGGEGISIERIDLSARVAAWLEAAIADADRRGLPELKPLLEGLAQSTTLLRRAHSEIDGRSAADGQDSDRK